MQVRVFVVQRADPHTGKAVGLPVSVKLTRAAAQPIAKANAPAIITPMYADKDSTRA